MNVTFKWRSLTLKGEEAHFRLIGMSIDQMEEVAKAFLIEKQGAGSINITSVKKKIGYRRTWEVKGDYAKKGSERNEAKFTITIYEPGNKVTEYEFEPP